MGVQVRLVFYAPDSSVAHKAASAVFDRIEQIENVLSNYRPDSESERLSATAYQRWTPVSADLAAVLEFALRLSAQSDGAFDITLGPLVRLWREVRLAGHLPNDDAVENARRRTGWQLIEFDKQARRVRLGRADMELDFGGIGKGYAADEALIVLAGYGVRRALIEMGGEIVLGNAPPQSDGWRIELPNAAGRPIVSLEKTAVSSSGDTEQFLLFDGVRYSHILDPKTGSGVTHQTQVTVRAHSGMIADGLSTLGCVLGEDQARLFYQRNFPEIIADFRTL